LVFGSLPDEYQCNGIARSTNQRCRCAALQGARFCRLHGGYRHAVPRQREAIGQHFESIAALRKGRQMLAAIGAQNPGMNPSIIERGMHASLVSFTDEENPDAE
jgi:hypothetical protein